MHIKKRRMVLAKSGSFTEKIGKNRNSIRKIHRRAAICEYTYYSQAYHDFFCLRGRLCPSSPLFPGIQWDRTLPRSIDLELKALESFLPDEHLKLSRFRFQNRTLKIRKFKLNYHQRNEINLFDYFFCQNKKSVTISQNGDLCETAKVLFRDKNWI